MFWGEYRDAALVWNGLKVLHDKQQQNKKKHYKIKKKPDN